MPCLYFLAFLLFRYTASRRPPQQHRPTSRSSGCRLGHQLASATGSVEKNESIFAEARQLEKHGLVKFHGGGFSLTDEGFLPSNSIIVHLLDCRKCTK